MDVWDDMLLENEDISNKIEALLDGEDGYILFFRKEGDIFAADEDSRVVFAKLKNPDDELPDGWADEANFPADNLSKQITSGRKHKGMFGKKDLSDIKVIDREDAADELKDLAKENPEGDYSRPDDNLLKVVFVKPDKDRDKAPNFILADEE